MLLITIAVAVLILAAINLPTIQKRQYTVVKPQVVKRKELPVQMGAQSPALP
jgi:hypothetical protein